MKSVPKIDSELVTVPGWKKPQTLRAAEAQREDSEKFLVVVFHT